MDVFYNAYLAHRDLMSHFFFNISELKNGITMPPAIDMDYCIIVIEKLINPLTPIEQIMPLLRDLMDSVPHPEMKKLAQKIVDPELDVVEKRKVMEEFKNFDHGGENDFTKVDYNELIDKFIDPNLPDYEYKPTMKALLEGDLDQERKNQVIEIINCHDKEQKAKMVKRFKSSFDRDREEKEREEAEKAKEIEARRLAKLKAKEEEANLLVFNDDGMTLIMRMLDKKIAREKKTEIYDRLMEPDVDAEIKNVALQMVSLTKQSERVQYVEDFKIRREQEKIAEAKRKKDEAQRKIDEENARKEQKMMRKNELLAFKNKDERMKKRELMLKMRAAERKRESQYVGPSSVQEREDQRRKERERVKEEMKRYKEKTLRDMKRAEREDMRREGWMVLPFDGNLNFDVKIMVPDLNSNLNESERAEFEKAKARMKEKMAGVVENKPLEVSTEGSKDAGKPGSNSNTASANIEEDPEFTKFFEIFSNPSLTEEEEKGHITALIKEGKGVLVRKLVAKLVSVPGVGKCVIFKSLAKKLGLTPPPPQASAPVQVNNSEATEESNNSVSPAGEGGSELPANETAIVDANVDEKKNTSAESEVKDVDASNVESGKVDVENSGVQSNTGTNGCDKEIAMKRKLSGESEHEEKTKKVKSDEHSGENKETKKRKRSEDDNESEEKKKKKKKKHKHKDEKERDKDREKSKKDKQTENGSGGEEMEKQKPVEKETFVKNDDIKDNSDKGSTEEIQKQKKPILSMTMEEIKEEFELTKIKSYIKIKNCSILAKQIKEQEVVRDKLWKEKREKEARERKAEQETNLKSQNTANGKDVSGNRSRSNSLVRSRSPTPEKIKSRPPSLNAGSKSSSVSRSGSPFMNNKNKSRANSGIPKSRSPSRSLDRPKSKPTSVVNSRSPSRSRSNSKARSQSKSVPPRSRSPSVVKSKSKPTSTVNSRSPTRSRSNSRARSRSPSKSIPPRSRSPSISSRSKSPSRSRSPIVSRSNSRSDLSLSRSRSRSRSKSRSLSRSRSKSRSKSISR